MNNPEYRTILRCPTVEEYLHLRHVAGLSPFSEEAARIGLPRSIFAVVIQHQDKAVGMGRIIGDGGCFFQITDIAVDPAHQGRGLGKAIMGALMDHADNLPKGAYLSLIADKPADRLYAQFGFHDVGPVSTGMARRA